MAKCYRSWHEWEQTEFKMTESFYKQCGFSEFRVKQLLREAWDNIHIKEVPRFKLSLDEARQQYYKTTFELDKMSNNVNR